MSLEAPKVLGLQAEYSRTTLYESYGPAIFGYLRLHLRSLEDAEDLLLEVFLAALEHDNLSALSPDKQLAWLRRVAHNKLLNTYRHVSRHPQIELETLLETLGTEDGPEQYTLRQEERAQLCAAIQKLPALQQYILQLRYADGLNCPAIALLLKKRESTVRKQLSRSIQFLRQAYQQSEGERSC